ncbi:hypothetical protein B0H10DRAFT_1940730 [Mycena sp. CBHHK59/15]|nr:hypothetical protein B0H10DRAFT_1940730 [Mycena sp. CBHHK59/15]
MNKKLPKWEHEGWVGVQHREVLRCVAAELKARKAPTIFKVAEPGSSDRTIIREQKVKLLTPRTSTIVKLAVVRDAIETTFGRNVSDADIWKAAAGKDFLPRPAQFLWKGIHNAHRVGKYWTHIPECEDRAMCKDCEVIPGQEIVWRAAETLWLKKEAVWPAVTLGTILGCGLAEFRDDKGKIKCGTQRLYRILVSESAYLIWKLRNNRVISHDGAPATEEEIVNKWKFTINQRLQVDRRGLGSRRVRLGKSRGRASKLLAMTDSGLGMKIVPVVVWFSFGIPGDRLRWGKHSPGTPVLVRGGLSDSRHDVEQEGAVGRD